MAKDEIKSRIRKIGVEPPPFGFQKPLTRPLEAELYTLNRAPAR